MVFPTVITVIAVDPDDSFFCLSLDAEESMVSIVENDSLASLITVITAITRLCKGRSGG